MKRAPAYGVFICGVHLATTSDFARKNRASGQPSREKLLAQRKRSTRALDMAAKALTPAALCDSLSATSRSGRSSPAQTCACGRPRTW
jgi:hypothetical protein